MSIIEIKSIKDIQNLVVAGCRDFTKYGNVNTQETDTLILFNYNDALIFDNEWSYFETVSRGLIICKKTGEVVARPFDKFFNWMQNGRFSTGYMKTIMEKLDGSIGILYRLNGEYLIATRGSFKSEQAVKATAMLRDKYNIRYVDDEIPNELTLIFEIIYPANRIVVDYYGRTELVLTAVRNRHTGEYVPFYPDGNSEHSVFELAEKFKFGLPKVYAFNNVNEIVEKLNWLSADDEGFVVEFSDGQRFKFKGNKYLELHRLLSGLSFRNTIKAVASGNEKYIRSQIPDEFRGTFDEWVRRVVQFTNDVTRKVEDAYQLAPKETRKEYAMYVTNKHNDIKGLMFLRYDNKDYKPHIYQMLDDSSEHETMRNGSLNGSEN